jgi:hypothetical protein
MRLAAIGLGAGRTVRLFTRLRQLLIGSSAAAARGLCPDVAVGRCYVLRAATA